MQRFPMLHHRITGTHSKYREGYQMQRNCVKCGFLFDARHCPECHKNRSRKNYSENPEKRIVVIKQWQARNKNKDNDNHIQWRKTHPELSRATRIKTNGGGTLSRGLKEKLFEAQRGKCACCSKPLGNKYEFDHKMPIALGGANEDWNMQLLRRECNLKKGAKHPIDFMQSKGFLL